MYIQCNGESYSIKHIKKKMDKIVLGDVLAHKEETYSLVLVED